MHLTYLGVQCNNRTRITYVNTIYCYKQQKLVTMNYYLTEYYYHYTDTYTTKCYHQINC